ncbi:MAG: acyloxyacyl hydrolase [Bacteroidales bacterium]|jgi:phage pi2 protein 07|nr:acyloxyacyl hydrolase [Bacteroidales bacterium]
MIRSLFLISFFIFNCLNLSGQEELKNPVSIAFKPQFGLILPHSSKVEHLTYTNPYGLELEYSWLMLKENNWQQCNCYSKAGISFLYVNYNNPKIVGSSYSLIGFAEPFFIRSNSFLFSARMGFGASFLDKIYDSETNPENTFFSTHISFIAHIDINAYYKLTDKYSLMVYAKYNHISNGGVKKPNYGMNFPMFGLGLNYYPSGKIVFPYREKKEFVPEYFYNIYSFGMVKKIEENEYFSEETTFVFGLYGLAGRTISKLNGFSIGLEYMNDGAAKEEILRKGLSDDHQIFSGLIGHHLLFGKFDFSQYWGTYIYAQYESRNFYQRYSLSYQFSKYVLVGVTLKTHGDVADSFHILLGLSF